MDDLKWGILFVCLMAASLWDLRTRTIPVPVLLIMAGAGFFMRMLEGSAGSVDFILCLLPGTVAAIAARLSSALGMGDALLLLGMGLLMSPERLLCAGFLALMAAGLLALLLLTVCRKKKDYELPFAPFLLSGTLLVYLGGRG